MRRRVFRILRTTLLTALAGAAACERAGPGGSADVASLPVCDGDDGSITLPRGFCAVVVADGLGRARHIAVAENGDIFVAAYATEDQPGGVIALRDTTGDGRADLRLRFGDTPGSGIALHRGYLYFGADDAIIRYPLPDGSLEPAGPPDTVIADLPAYAGHRAKTIVIDDLGAVFVNIGSPGNVCQPRGAEPRTPGADPCPELETRAGVWRFDAHLTGQSQADGARYATGLRNMVALALNPADGLLYGVQHGRDRLHQSWPEMFSAEDGAEKPSEEFVRILEDRDFGWPYCYHDASLGRKVLAPEYGGDGLAAGRCDAVEEPILAFPGHWAPNALLFHSGRQFPDRYAGGAFVAFHGSWNRAPLEQAGYKVVFVPFLNGAPAGAYEVFADGFAGQVRQPGDADHRPTGLAEGPDGSLYISDSRRGRIWRIVHTGRARR